MATGRRLLAEQSKIRLRGNAADVDSFLLVMGNVRKTVLPDGEYGLNYLCRGYYEFFKHVAPYMEFMKTEILSGREAANIMNHIDELKINDDE